MGPGKEEIMEATKPAVAVRKASTVKHFPLMYNYAFPVSGNGFLVHIALRGRLLMEEEGDEVWIYGVNPGGISIFAPTRDAALNKFTTRLHEVMNGVAEATTTFGAFKKEVEELFTTNEEFEKLWKSAHQSVRDAKTTIDGMTREEKDTVQGIVIQKVTNPKPAMNISEKQVTLAAS